MCDKDMEHKFSKDNCELTIPLPSANAYKPASQRKDIVNWRNCDVFINNNTFCIYVESVLLRFHFNRIFDWQELKEVLIHYDTSARRYKITLPCLPLGTVDPTQPDAFNKDIYEVARLNKRDILGRCPIHELSSLQCITSKCRLIVDNDAANCMQLEQNFPYGFGQCYSGPVRLDGADERVIVLRNPHACSPLQRTIRRVNDEKQNFSREQYKLNFMQLQIPEGHQNPLKYELKLEDCLLNDEQYCSLQEILKDTLSTDGWNRNNVDCGLLSLLLAICYDVRCTGGDATCESHWTRSMLSSMFGYFETFESFNDVIYGFVRRVLIYPYFRNYELARLCIRDASKVLKSGRKWLMKQLLVTLELFASSDRKLGVLNELYIEPYLRYVCSSELLSNTQLEEMSMNVRNTLPDVRKRYLGLGLELIEAEIIKELMSEVTLRAGGVEANDAEYEEALVNDLGGEGELMDMGDDGIIDLTDFVDVDADVDDEDDDDDDNDNDDDDGEENDAQEGNHNDEEENDNDDDDEEDDDEDDDDDEEDEDDELEEDEENENGADDDENASAVIKDVIEKQLSVELNQLQINSTKGTQNALNNEKLATADAEISDGELLLLSNLKKKMLNDAKWAAGCSSSKFNENSAIQK